ncbi:putative ribonuclease H-like domain-containing protein [Tanacetum coccineum]|uniref:Ribonuclease H-like domain-containing protein n=1 Tax=Tanacetum coccineum TaxID=301880 RepID=A0ABQ4WFF7_9ASTR
MTHPHPNRRFVPQAVLTKSSKINTTGASVNTAVRPVNTAGSKPTVNHPRPISNAYKKRYSQVTRPFNKHMTGNKCYLTEYEDYDGGFVSFGDGKGRISGKGKIKTGTLDFDNVYFCKELKYNLFSVSQICDKKNNVLFTDTECLVLSSDFKLLDESQVLLRVPRKDNIYSVDLKSIVPTKGLTCLFAKATIDESKLWYRRLGHINFKNMNKLVRGNLVRGLPSKIFENDHSCVACQKGKQHKASYLCLRQELLEYMDVHDNDASESSKPSWGKMPQHAGFGKPKIVGNPQQKEYKEKGVIDSGCSRHMTGNKCYLTEYEDYDGGFVSFGDGKGRISGKGKIKTGTLDFDNVYFCKELKYNLFSVSQICDKKNNVLFTDTECLVLSSDFKLLDESQVLLRVLRKDNIYSFDLKSVVPTKGLTCLFAKAIIDESNLWHKRLGHINFKNINKLVKVNLVRGLPSKIFENDHSCVACQKGKQHKASCKAKLVNSISKPLNMLHMDLFGPINVKSLMKKSHCLDVTDNFSRFSWVFFLATKDETTGILKNFITEIENQLDHKVKVIRCDNGTEFKNSVMIQFCEMKGIKREFNVARTPRQNGVAERRNRTLIEAARTMLVDSKLPTTFWAEVVNTACYVLNKVLVIKPHNKTPYELIRGRTPLIDFMKPFGCPDTILNTKDHLGKFDGKADGGVFCWVLCVVAGNQTNGIAGTRDNIVAGQAEKKKEPEQEYILIPFCTFDPLISQDPKVSEEDAEEKPTEMDESGASDKDGKDEQTTRGDTLVSIAGPSCTDDDLSSQVNAAEASNAFEEHLFKQFSPFKNAFTLPPVTNVTPMDDTGIFGNAYDDEDVGAVADLNNLETTMNVSPIPTTRIDKDHPKDHIIGDFNSAIQTRRMTKITDEHAMVCTLVDLPNGKRPIGTKWVFRNEKDERGIVVRNKARLMDVKSAFLYGIIKEEVYVCQPPGFEDPHFLDKVYKVEKALYGLYQAPKAWYETLSTYLIENGFRRGTIDKTLFIKKDKGDILLVQVYVDDIIFGFTNKSLCDEFEGLMHKRFQISSIGELTFFLGLQVQQKEDKIFISQDKYVAEILKKFDFATVKTASTPIETNKALVKDEEAEAVDVHLYRSMIGSLMYLTASRPDIMFVVCACARFQVTPKMSHLQAVKRIFRYLKGQPKLGLWYPRDSPFDLEAFSDSDYAGVSLDRKSTTRGCQFLGKRLISWQCKKRTIVANFTTEAEYVAAANCCRQALWIQNQMLDYGFNFMNT